MNWSTCWYTVKLVPKHCTTWWWCSAQCCIVQYEQCCMDCRSHFGFCDLTLNREPASQAVTYLCSVVASSVCLSPRSPTRISWKSNFRKPPFTNEFLEFFTVGLCSLVVVAHNHKSTSTISIPFAFPLKTRALFRKKNLATTRKIVVLWVRSWNSPIRILKCLLYQE